MKQQSALSSQDLAMLRRYGLNGHALHGCTAREYGFGEHIVTQGLPLDELFVVTDGKAKVGVAAPNGKNLILCFYVSDGLIGDAEFFADIRTGKTTVVALGRFRCVAIPVSVNREWLWRSLRFAQSAAAELAKKLSGTDAVALSSLYPADARLCRYILGAAESGVFRDIMTDVACSIGVSYRHLYRTLGALCADGLLEKSPAGYRILDLPALAARALTEK